MNLEEDSQELSEPQEAVIRQRKNQRSCIRKTIRILQEIPLVVSVVVFTVMIADIAGYNISKYTYPLFGFSFYILVRLFSAACAMHVSLWSKSLYLQQIIISVIEFADNLCNLSDKVIHFQQVMNTVIIAGILSSFITFLYGKFKSLNKQYN